MDSLGEGRYCGTLAFTGLAQWTAGTRGVPRYHRMHVLQLSAFAGDSVCTYCTVQTAWCGGQQAGCQKKNKPRKSKLCTLQC